MAGAAGAAEAGVVGVGAETGVDDQLAVGQFRLVHALWREVRTCSSTDKPSHSHCRVRFSAIYWSQSALQPTFRAEAATLLFPLPTLLRIFGDPDFGRGAHRVDASVGVAGVGALVRRLHVVQDQAAVRRRLDVATVGTHGDAVPATEQWEVSLDKNNKT